MSLVSEATRSAVLNLGIHLCVPWRSDLGPRQVVSVAGFPFPLSAFLAAESAGLTLLRVSLANLSGAT